MLTKKPGASLLPTGEQCTASAAAVRRATVAGPGDRGGGWGTSWRGGAGRYGDEPRVPASQAAQGEAGGVPPEPLDSPTAAVDSIIANVVKIRPVTAAGRWRGRTGPSRGAVLQRAGGLARICRGCHHRPPGCLFIASVS